MKTKRFTIGLCLAATLVACDREQNQDLIRPDDGPRILENFEVLPEISETASIYEILDVDGNVPPGIQQISIESSAEKVESLVFFEAEIEDFFEAYETPIIVSEGLPTKGVIQSKVRTASVPEVPQISTTCASAPCRTLVQQETQRLQRVATDNCLTLMATVICCDAGQAKSIGVYITPGVVCEQRTKQELNPESLRETH